MSFLDRAKAAASGLAAKADTALGNAGIGGPKAPGTITPDAGFHDLGVMAYLEATGRPIDPDDRQRVMTAMQEVEAQGAIRTFELRTAAPPASEVAGASPQEPPPPGAPGVTAPPPPEVFDVAVPSPGPAGVMIPPIAAISPQDQQAPAAAPAAPPPLPSWMKKDGDDAT